MAFWLYRYSILGGLHSLGTSITQISDFDPRSLPRLRIANAMDVAQAPKLDGLVGACSCYRLIPISCMSHVKRSYNEAKDKSQVTWISYHERLYGSFFVQSQEAALGSEKGFCTRAIFIPPFTPSTDRKSSNIAERNATIPSHAHAHSNYTISSYQLTSPSLTSVSHTTQRKPDSTYLQQHG